MAEKTISEKMYLRNAKSLAVLNGAANPRVAAQMPPELIDEGDGPDDVVLMFVEDRKELDELFPKALERLDDRGALWIAYHKPSPAHRTDVNRDTINTYASERGITPVAMIALDKDWSALRLKRL